MTKKAARKKGPGPLPAGSAKTPGVLVACGQEWDIGIPVIKWKDRGGLVCPNPRGRIACTQHDPLLNDAPTRPFSQYRIENPATAYAELKKTIHQLILHYDVCFTSKHCHQVLEDSAFKGSHFYLDLDGTLYQTCDLYWKTNTAPADDRKGNERAVHVEMANLSWQALAEESDLHKLTQDAYVKTSKGWRLNLPGRYRKQLRDSGYQPIAARGYGERGYFSRKINGRQVRMWDFTEAQYVSLIALCRGVHQLLPRVKLRVPFDSEKHRTPLDRIPRFSSFQGILGHAHVQSGKTGAVKRKFDPGSAFDWGRLRQAFGQ